MLFLNENGHYSAQRIELQKDWWVSFIPEINFPMTVAKHLVFKGGTSLSKAWKLINRFSEDFDLAIHKYPFDQVHLELLHLSGR